MVPSLESCVGSLFCKNVCLSFCVCVFCAERGEEIRYVELQTIPKFEVPINVVEVIVLS